MFRSPTILCLAALTLMAPRLHAQASIAGTPVAATHLAAESNPTVLADGTGGAFVGFKIAWRSASLPTDVAVARILASGGRHPEWSALPPLPAGSLPQNPSGTARMLVAPQGKALVFADVANASPADQLMVRELSAQGADPAYAGFSPDNTYQVFNEVSRSNGGVLIAGKLPGSANCFVTLVAPNGTGTEILDPIPLPYSFTVTNDRVAAVRSGVDGAIAILQYPFVTGGATGTDMVAVRIDAAGQLAWNPGFRTVVAAANNQSEQVATSDEADGVITAWLDLRTGTGNGDIYAERLLSTGDVAPGWTAGGKVIASGTAAQSGEVIESDGAGGAWIAWGHDRNVTTGRDLYFTHVLANGTFASGFPANGRVLCNADSTQTGVQITRDGNGGLFAVWLDTRDGETDLYAQHLDANGNPTAGWAANGNPVCTEGSPQAQAALGWVSNGRAIAAWKDARTGTDIVYAAALDAVRGVLDVPNAAVPPRLALAPGANPARGAVELKLDAADAGEVTVTLFDVTGRVRSSRVVAGGARDASVRFDALEPGLYFASAAQRDARTSAKVVVVR